MTNLKPHDKSLLREFLESIVWKSIQEQTNKERQNIISRLASVSNTRDEDMKYKGELSGLGILNTIINRMIKSGSSEESG